MRPLRLLALALAAFLSGFGLARADGYDRIVERGVVRVCTSTDTRPLTFITPEGKMAGLLPDLIRDVGAGLSTATGKPLAVEFVRITPLNRIEFLNQGRCDLLLAPFLETPARRRVVDFVQPGFYASRAALLAPAASPYKAWEDLRGRTVCAPATSAWVKAYEQRYGIRFASYPTTQESRLAALRGQCAGMMMDDVIANAMIASGSAPGFKSVLPVQDAFPWSIAVKKGEPRLKAALGRVAADWHATGRIVQLEKTWGLRPNPFARSLTAGAGPAEPTQGLRYWLAKRGLNFGFLWDRADRDRLLKGLGATLLLAALSIPAALGVGGLLVWAARASPLAARLVGGYVDFVRATPVLAQLYLLYFGIGGLLGTGEAAGAPLAFATLTLALHYGALCADSLRGSIDAVSGPLREASAALGLNGRQQFSHVMLPLGVRLAVPALGNVAIQILKTTTIAYAIAVPELLYAINRIWADNANAPEAMAVFFVLFLALCTGLTALLRRIERRLALPGYAHVR